MLVSRKVCILVYLRGLNTVKSGCVVRSFPFFGLGVQYAVSGLQFLHLDGFGATTLAGDEFALYHRTSWPHTAFRGLYIIISLVFVRGLFLRNIVSLCENEVD